MTFATYVRATEARVAAIEASESTMSRPLEVSLVTILREVHRPVRVSELYDRLRACCAPHTIDATLSKLADAGQIHRGDDLNTWETTRR